MVLRFTILLSVFLSVTVWGQERSVTDERLRELVFIRGQATVKIAYPGYKEASKLARELPVDRYCDGYLLLVLSELNIEKFLEKGLSYKIVDDTGDSKSIINAGSVAEAMEWQSYPTWPQYDSIMHLLAETYPALCRVDTIGTSVDGRLVLVLKISSDVNYDDHSKPEVFYTSTMHGDELAGYVVMLRLASWLLENYTTNSLANRLVSGLQIYINPLANPDGTYRSDNLITNPRRQNANGYDLNRNFPDPANSSTTYQKETLDMIAWMGSRRFVLSANFHSGEEVLNYPWDRWSRMHADDNWFVRLCRTYAGTVHIYGRDGYMSGFDNGIVRGSVWYMITGGRMDFVTYELQGREVTIEIDNTKLTPADSLESIWNYNYRSLLNYLGFALTGATGVVTDRDTGEPVGARISIDTHDTDSSHIYSSSVTGRYRRLLAAGMWDLTFSAPGYKDTIISNIAVGWEGETPLDVPLVPIVNHDTTTGSDEMILWPNPAKGMVSLTLPSGFEGDIEIGVITTAGRLVFSVVRENLTGVPLEINMPAIAPGVYIVRVSHRATGKQRSAPLLVL